MKRRIRRKRGRPPRGPAVRVVADIDPELAKMMHSYARASGRTIWSIVEGGVRRELEAVS